MANLQIATIARTQDYTAIKHNEDHRTVVQQANLGEQHQKEIRHRAQEVRSGDESRWQNRKFDAKEKGDNQYTGDGGARRGKQGQQSAPEHHGFDIKI